MESLRQQAIPVSEWKVAQLISMLQPTRLTHLHDELMNLLLLLFRVSVLLLV